MKTFSTLLFLFLLPTFALSQNINFSISGRSGYTLPSNYNSTTEYIGGTIRTYLNDSMATLRLVDSKQEIMIHYKSKVAYELEANIDFLINEKISIQTGIGLNWTSFKRTSEFISGESIIRDGVDTVSYDWSSVNYIQCDRYVNEEIFDEREDGERFQRVKFNYSSKYKIFDSKY